MFCNMYEKNLVKLQKNEFSVIGLIRIKNTYIYYKSTVIVKLQIIFCEFYMTRSRCMQSTGQIRMQELYLVEAGVCLRQVVVLVVQPRDFKGHLAHAADGNTITSGSEKQILFLKFVAVVVQNLGKDERKEKKFKAETKGPTKTIHIATQELTSIDF